VIERLHVVDFKGIRDLEVSLRPLTVLVGANGVGKTSLLEAVYVVGLAVRRPGGSDRGTFDVGRWAREHLIRSGASALRIDLSSDVGAMSLHTPRAGGVALSLGGPDSDAPGLSMAREDSGLTLLGDRPATEAERDLIASHIATVGAATRVRFDPERMSAAAAVSSVVPRLSHDGAGLPALLQYLHGLRDGSVEAIEAAVRAIVPRFRRVQFCPTSIHEVKTEYLSVEGQQVPRVVEHDQAGVELLVAFDDGAVVPAAHVSEGTLLALAALTLAHAPSVHQRRTILIDDLDRALHPAAQHRLVEALYKVLAATPDLQILATTHSPDLVDACAAEDVRVLSRDAEGHTAARALSEHPEAEKWLKLLRVGEFWGTVGEDWVTAAAPTP